MNNSTKTGIVGGMFSNVLLKASQGYHSAQQALLEPLQNSIDEPTTTRIWVLLDKANNSIQIGDNGPGMGGPMSEEAKEWVNVYYSIINEGVAPGYDLRELIMEVGEANFHTLEWLITNVAYSVKADSTISSEGQPNEKLTQLLKDRQLKPRKRPRRSTIGQFGIGVWSFLVYANDMTIISKPNRGLCQGLGVKYGTTYYLVPPGKSQLANFQIAYQLSETQESVIDLEGKELESGTVITITGIAEEEWGELTVDKLATYFRDYFGARIAETHTEIVVVDNEGNYREVEEQVFKGQKILDTTFASYDDSPCRIKLYYDRKARSRLYPRVTKYNVTICPLSDIRYRGQPVFGGFWESGRLAGNIAFEHVNSGDDKLFDPSKHRPSDSPQLRIWINQVKKFEPEIQTAIDKIEREATDERLTGSQDLLKSILTGALKSQGLDLPNWPNPDNRPQTKAGAAESKVVQPFKGLQVRVVDRGGRGVQGVDLLLKGSRGLKIDRKTGVSGTIQFGRLEPGDYIIDVLTSIQVRGSSREKFTIDPKRNRMGHRATFVLETGQPTPRFVGNEIDVSFNSWNDPGEPWRQNIAALQLVEFNIAESTRLRSELDNERYAVADALMAQYATSAVMEALGENGEHAGRVRESNLYAEIFSRLQTARNEGTRATRSDSGKKAKATKSEAAAEPGPAAKV